MSVRNGGVWKTDSPNAKVLVARLEPGDAFRVRPRRRPRISPGGPIDAVCDDVRQGYVSVKAATQLYGGGGDPTTLEVDTVATERLRAAHR